MVESYDLKVGSMDSLDEALQKVSLGYVAQFCTQSEIFGPQDGPMGIFMVQKIAHLGAQIWPKLA